MNAIVHPLPEVAVIEIDNGDWDKIREKAIRLKRDGQCLVGLRVVFEGLIEGQVPKSLNERGEYAPLGEADLLNPNSGPFYIVIDAAERYQKLKTRKLSDRLAPPTGQANFDELFVEAWELLVEALPTAPSHG